MATATAITCGMMISIAYGGPAWITSTKISTEA